MVDKLIEGVGKLHADPHFLTFELDYPGLVDHPTDPNAVKMLTLQIHRVRFPPFADIGETRILLSNGQQLVRDLPDELLIALRDGLNLIFPPTP